MSLRNLIKCIELGVPSLVAMDSKIHLNHAGYLWGIHLLADVPASTTITLVMETSDDYYQHVLAPIVVCDKECEVTYCKNVVFTAGTGTDVKSEIKNNNHKYFTNISTVQQFRTGVTVTDTGTCFYSDYLPASKFSSAVSPEFIGWVLDKDTVYSANLENKDVQVARVKFSLFWYEKEV